MPARLTSEDRPRLRWIGISAWNDLRFRLNTIMCRALGVPLEGRPTGAHDYARPFVLLPRPAVQAAYEHDRFFAWMRVAGLNPTVLERYREDRDHDLDLRCVRLEAVSALRGESLEGLRAEGRLYVADYPALTAAGAALEGQKHRVVPTALFGVSRETWRLVPIAIQVERRSRRPLFHPDGGWGWRMARTTVDCADINLQQPVVHGFSHVFCGTLATAARRQLSPRHPVAKLLAPHTEGTLFINDLAVDGLLSFGTLVDDIMTGPIPAIRRLIADNLLAKPVIDRSLPRDLALRGVDDPAVLPQYPYREDGLDLWHAIAAWVSDYLDLYYPDDATCARDPELLAWAHDISSAEGGRLHGLSSTGSLDTRAALKELLTLAIYNASVQHAATNFPQGPIMTFAPAAPMGCWCLPSERPDGWTEEQWLAMLPPLERAYQQVELGYRLYATRYTQLGDYRRGAFTDPRVAAPLRAFRARLEVIEHRIHVRNQRRDFPYDYLRPSRIPQSVNI